jgi:ComF family protein
LEPLLRPFCEICGQSYSSGGGGAFRCSNCGDRRFAFAFAVAPYHSRGMLREMVHRFKFGKVMQLRRPLGLLLGRVFDDPRLGGSDWVLVPVPIHPRRQRHRTFNQSLELARVLAREKNLPLVQALRRTKFTPPQSRLNRQQRLENLAASIAPVPKAMAALAGRDILLVDDIFTTGSTGQACASVLIANGARKVVVITLARG